MNLTEKLLQFTLGGAEWVLWLLIVLSVFSVYVMLERFLFFRTVSGVDAALRRPLLEALSAGDRAAARKLAEGSAGTGARMAAEMLRHHGSGIGAASADAFMQAVRPGEKLRLERNLSYLGTLGANAPFIGLFGTVLGIIKAFKDLADSGIKPGGDSAAAVMTGISEALVATAVGLLVAIPAVVAYNFFQRKVKALLGEADGLASMVRGFLESAAGGSGTQS
jgi:biopolymer transport protein ExbB